MIGSLLRSQLGKRIAKHRQAALILVLLAGLLGATALVVYHGTAKVGLALAAAGWLGLAAVCGIRTVSFFVRAIAWRLIIPAGTPPPGLLACLCGRVLREGFGNLFALGPISGEFAGGRFLVLAGVNPRMATASVIVDLALESAGQITFVVAGFLVALVHLSTAQLAPWLVTVAVAVLVVTLMPLAARSRFALHIFENILSKLARRSAADLGDHEVLATIVRGTFRWRRPLLASAALHLAAWPLLAFEIWTLGRVAGWPLTPANAVIIEALVLAARTALFFVPLSMGIQEEGYVVAGALVGLAAGPALAISLLKRARDIVLAVPAILVWQVLEWRSWRSHAGPGRAGNPHCAPQTPGRPYAS